MTMPVRIKRSNVNGTPSSLLEGELAFSNDYLTHTGDGSLYIGADDDAAGVVVRKIGGTDGLYKSLFNANTIIAADADDTPAALTIPEQTIVGRITAGNIDALTAAEVRTLINVTDGAAPDQNLFETFTIDNTDTEYTWAGTDGSVVADAVDDTIKFVAGTNITLDYDATNDAIKIVASGGGTGDVSSSGSGFADGEIVLYADATGNLIKTANVTLADLYAFKTVTGDTGTATADGNADTIAITGLTGITTVATAGAGAGLTIDLDDTAVTPTTYGAAATVGTFTVDQQGRITSATDVSIQIAESQITDGTLLARVAGNETISGDWDISTGTLIVGTPTLDGHAAPKSYVDSVAQGLDPKDSVRAATDGNISLTGEQTIDGVSVVADDRVLVKNQTTPNQNGIYVASAGAWSRSSDTDTWAELVSAYVFVEEGTSNADTGWNCTVDAGGTLGTTDVTWTQFSSAGSYVAGAGLQLDGNEFNVYGGLSGQVLVGQGAAADAAWGALDVANANAITGLLPASHGGTGINTPAANAILYGSAGDTMSVLAGATGGTAGAHYVMAQPADGGAPSWLTEIDGGTY